MQRVAHSLRTLKNKRKLSIKSIDNSKKKSNHSNMPINKSKKISIIIKQIEHGLHLLKTFYEEQILHSQKISGKITFRKSVRPLSSHAPNKPKVHQLYDEQTITTVVPELDDLKKSFTNTYGYNSNNVVQLFNFYKKNYQKSTKLFASTSISNVNNLTQNQSELKDKGTKTNYFMNIGKKGKQNKCQIKSQREHEQNKLLTANDRNIEKKQNEKVNVGTLLAQKKRISRKNIIDNINTQNLIHQTKKKLFKINLHENLEKFNKIKENLRCQSINNCQNHHISNIKQKSPSTKENIVKICKENTYEQLQKIMQKDKAVKKSEIEKVRSQQNKQDIISIKNINNNELDQEKKDISAFELRSGSKQSYQSNEKEKDKKKAQGKQLTEIKSIKSVGSIKLTYSQSSKKSGLLNQGILISASGSQKQKCEKPAYFLPRLHNNPHDSLLDCSITPKQPSKILDLQSIPFDF